MPELTIPENIYERILTIIGFPIVDPEDWKLTEGQIKNLMIFRAFEEYFNFFPLLEKDHKSVEYTFSIPFPDEYTYGITDARVNTRPADGGFQTGNPLINEMQIRVKHGGSGIRMWGTENDYGFQQVRIFSRLERQAFQELEKATRIYVNERDRIVEGYSNQYGSLSITWAKWSDNWDDIRRVYREDVIKLSQAYVAEFMGNLISLSNVDLPNQLDEGELLSRASDYRDEVLDKWREAPRPVILR